MWKLKLSSGAFIAPSFVGVLIFFILPFLVVIYYSLVDNPISGNFVFLDNFGAVIRNGAFKKAVHNTLTFSAVAVPLAVALSLLLAIVLEAKLPFRSQFRTFFLSPMMVPVASIVLIWQVLFHYNGAVNLSLIHILTSHEQGAAHAADGYARATGKVGVCMATSGPGATNLVTGIATAYMLSLIHISFAKTHNESCFLAAMQLILLIMGR